MAQRKHRAEGDEVRGYLATSKGRTCCQPLLVSRLSLHPAQGLTFFVCVQTTFARVEPKEKSLEEPQSPFVDMILSGARGMTSEMVRSVRDIVLLSGAPCQGGLGVSRDGAGGDKGA